MSNYFVTAQPQGNVTVEVTPSTYEVVPETNEFTVVVGNSTGPAGPQGPSGASGKIGVVTGTSIIPDDQFFTVFNGSGPASLTLPLIADIFDGITATSFTVRNVTNYLLTILPAGSDLIESDTSIVLNNQRSSWTFIPTSLGWLII